MNPILDIFPDQQQSSQNHFSAIRISLANPELIRKPAQEGGWSWGEVTKPETINYRSFKPEKDGIFCAQIFGPVKDYECLCKKYKHRKHRSLVCEKCKVEVTTAKVRRERMGHIDLAAPVAHIWFLKSLPSRIGSLLDITLKDVEQVLYCLSLIITYVDEQALNDFYAALGGEVALGVEELKKIFAHHYKKYGGLEDGHGAIIEPEVGMLLTEDDHERLHNQYTFISEYYSEYLEDNLPLIKRAVEIASEQLGLTGERVTAQPLSALIDGRGRLSTSKVAVDREPVGRWLSHLRAPATEAERYRDRCAVLTWRLAGGAYALEVTAGDELPQPLKDAISAALPALAASGEPVTLSDGAHDGAHLLPMSSASPAGAPGAASAEEGVLVLTYGCKGFKRGVSSESLKTLSALFKAALTHVYGDDLLSAFEGPVESACHSKLTVRFPKHDGAYDALQRDLISLFAAEPVDLVDGVAKLARKLMPQSFLSVVTSRLDARGEQVYYTVAGDYVSAGAGAQERLRALVHAANAKVSLQQDTLSALVFPINDAPVNDASDEQRYYLYLQNIEVNAADLAHLREVFAYALKALTRDVVVSLNDGRVDLSGVTALEVHTPPAFERQLNEKQESVAFSKERTFTPTGVHVVSEDNGVARVITGDGISEELLPLKYGDTLCAPNGAEVKHSQPLAEWRWAPFLKPILSPIDGIVSFPKDAARPGDTARKVQVYHLQVETVAGGFRLSRSRSKGRFVELELPKGALLKVQEGDLIGRGQPLAMVESAQTSDKNTEHKVQEQLTKKLAEQLSRFPSFRVAAGDGDLRVMKSNEAFSKIFGFSLSETEHIPVDKFLGPDAMDRFEALAGRGLLADSGARASRALLVIEQWDKGAQFLRTQQSVTLLGLVALGERGAEVDFFVLEASAATLALASVISHLRDVVVDIEQQLAGRERDLDEDFYDPAPEDLNEQFRALFETFDPELLTRVERLLEQGRDAAWHEHIATLANAARFSHHLDGHDSERQFFDADMGADAIRKRLRTLDLFSLYKTLEGRIPSVAQDLINTAFGSGSAYFFEEVDYHGFKPLEDLLRAHKLTLPEQGDVWSGADYKALCELVRQRDGDLSPEHRPLFRAIPTNLAPSAEGPEEQFILHSLSSALCKEFGVSLGQVVSRDLHARISQRAFVDGETDHYIVKEVFKGPGSDPSVHPGHQIGHRKYLELREEASISRRTFTAQPSFEAQSLKAACERFAQELHSLPLDGLARLSQSIRSSSVVSADLALRKEADRLIDMVRWLRTLDHLKAFESPSNDLRATSNEERLERLRCSYFDKSDPHLLTEQQLQSREWFLLTVISEFLRIEMLDASDSRKKKFIKRLKVVDAIRNSESRAADLTTSEGRREWMGNKPEWMILEAIPVIPPDLRPLVPLEGGRFATSDLNDLYRRVITRNARLRRLTEELQAPQMVQRNEKRMLQEAVDALFDNGRRGKPITSTNKRPFKSLSAMIKGKQGRFRQNLLGKRVDYSGRSVIVVGPELRLHQCGLPKKMALELFKPFILNKLESLRYATTIKAAKKMVDDCHEVVWDILDDVIQEHPVMLNRAPTLHRLGIQAFEPKLIEGKAIQLHPLVCTAFNADFDGDQMAVHLPLSVEAQIEARVLMMSSNNILSPANGKPIIVPSQDIVLGCYYMTRERPFAKGEGRVFTSPTEARVALETGAVHLQAKVRCRMSAGLVDTTVGRLIMSEVLPPQLEFALVNRPMGKKELAQLIDVAYRRCTAKQTVLLADAIKDLGYAQATRAGISVALADLNVSDEKRKLVKEGYEQIATFQRQASDGEISNKERYNKVVDQWTQITERVAKAMFEAISTETFTNAQGETRKAPSFNSVFIMSDSGARGGPQQIRQLAGMRGLMAKPSGEIIETPITANFREGLSVLEYFISAHGARKGLADTALKTANSGYLTRRLVDVAQDAIITEYDCGAQTPLEIRALVDGNEVKERLSDLALGRVLAEDVYSSEGELLIPALTLVGEREVELIDTHDVQNAYIRSPLTCETRRGVCALCYGRDLARGRLVNVGEAVGVIAAQSIGEPGTQLTMRTFHIGGAASQQARKNSIISRTEGRVRLKNAKLITPTLAPASKRDGTQVVVEWERDGAPSFAQQPYQLVSNRNAHLYIDDHNGVEKESHALNEGYMLDIRHASDVHPGQRVVHWDPFSTSLFSEVEGVAVLHNVSLEEGTLREESESGGNVIRRISAPTRNSARAQSKKTSKRGKAEQGTSNSPRVEICAPIFKRVDDQWVVLPGEVVTLRAEDGTERKASYDLPVDAKLEIFSGALIGAGQPLAKLDIEAAKTKDITGGLPRVAELFEARAKEKSAVLSRVDGRVQEIIGENPKRVVRVVTDEQQSEDHLVKGQQVIVREGDIVRAGDALSDGPLSPHEILSVKSEMAVAEYLVNEIQQVYRLQGVRINDKHIEVIVRQMLRRVRIKEVGDAHFLPDEQVEKWVLDEENARLSADPTKRPAIAEPLLLGITKASLATDSFISASSFQETTKVLTAAALKGKVDYLHGLKENVIMGRLIPAGTGLKAYRSLSHEVGPQDLD